MTHPFAQIRRFSKAGNRAPATNFRARTNDGGWPRADQGAMTDFTGAAQAAAGFEFLPLRPSVAARVPLPLFISRSCFPCAFPLTGPYSRTGCRPRRSIPFPLFCSRGSPAAPLPLLDRSPRDVGPCCRSQPRCLFKTSLPDQARAAQGGRVRRRQALLRASPAQKQKGGNVAASDRSRRSPRLAHSSRAVRRRNEMVGFLPGIGPTRH
ncbi:MAG: hypothetical protein BWZ08_00218 [candidate division BRC1 bacterium ADurb.BinA292]|nr:MAG: hypothetical protein BWZ08_00218 [candidate division BRC1 bacterium ADurb.BinA292]